MDKLTGAGGTPGGIPMFLIGFAMAVAGGYLLTSQVTVTTGFWTFFGQHTFGLSLLPFIVGVLMLFMDGRSKPGWLLLLAGVVIIRVRSNPSDIAPNRFGVAFRPKTCIGIGDGQRTDPLRHDPRLHGATP